MPHLFSFASNHGQLEDMQELGGDHAYEQQRKGSVFGRLQSLQRIGNWLKRDEEVTTPTQQWQQWDEQKAQEASREDTTPQRRPSLLGRRISRRVIPELPRPQTFRRQNSERRERLEPVEPSAFEKRALSADRRTGFNRQRLRSPPPTHIPSLSAPEVGTPDQYQALTPVKEQPGQTGGEDASGVRDEPISGQPPATGEAPFLDDHEDDDHSEVMDPRELQAELDAKWILNLSMHFRDKSDREKFFVTYAQEPNRWRRVTVSCDYRNAQPDSLEADLRTLHYQRDKSMRIYEAIRESLPDIQFYDSVTNLKLETDDGRLHVHVTEDVNEIIAYPSASLVRHVECPCYRESELHFESHLSGFVYKVNASGRTFIKKEIPGPDTVDEFLYEINALDSLRGSESVIQFHGLVTDEGGDLIKGLLISFASQGALVDLLFDYKDTDALPWPRREQWARQIITGLSEIHEAGFVQGDFTLSNIVIDSEDNAKIIDINRRGCPVGWEPPELSKLIKSGQRISMVIGVKSDLFQLGMVLWALAEKVDEPEREEKPLVPVTASDVPEWFKFVVKSCLSDRPQHRMSAKSSSLISPDPLVLMKSRKRT
ncbi:hypothetical protein H2203_005076 [Taxawa tesnikishii (nom. ined.)]|nr:hypothetical protein H2203_005076 [Dothideales sp. JES 119]